MVLEKLVIPIGFDMGLLLEGIKAIEGLISGAIDRTQQWAEDMDALGDVTGMSTDKLAAWSFVTKKRAWMLTHSQMRLSSWRKACLIQVAN